MANKKQVKGALPCGNPKRFESLDVIAMTKKRKALDSGDIETESEKHIKVMVENQLNVDISVDDQFSQHRSFTASSAYDPKADKLIGLHAFEQHKQINELDSKVDYFRQCGLTEEEIKLMLKKEAPSGDSNSYGPDPAMEQKWMEEIQKKIENKERDLKKPDSFKGALELSRQCLDLEKSIIAQQQNKAVTLPNGIITQKKYSWSHPSDPINHLPEIIKHITPKPEREPRRDRRRRRKLHRQMLRQELYTKEAKKEEKCYSEDEDLNSDTDICETQCCTSQDATISTSESIDGADVSCLENQSAVHPQNCEITSSKSNKANDKENDFSEFKNIASISKEEILANRLCLEEILRINKFSNYQVGDPNKILYVKNLPNDAKGEDFAALLSRFDTDEEHRITYKLLSGRMKGQAFITFPDTTIAGQAIDLLNGYKLRDKPIILSYGKKKTSS